METIYIDNTTVMDDINFFSETTTMSAMEALKNSTTLSFSQKAYRLVVPTIGVLVVLMNGLVILSSGLILKRQVQPRTTYMFLGNIALCDLVTGVTVIFGSVFPKTWRNHYFCCFQLGLIVASTIASVWSIGLVALDRFLFIVHGIKYTQWVYVSRARLLILSTWAMALTIGALPALGWDLGLTNNGKICWLVLLAPKPLLGIIVVLGWIPLLMNGFLYLIILYYALRKIIQLKDVDDKGTTTVNNMRLSRGGGSKNSKAPNTMEKTNQGSSKWKAIKVVAFTTGAYLITWVPYTTACLVYIFCTDPAFCKTIAQLIASPLAILIFANSLLNPIIYAWWHKPFRKHAVNVIRRKKQLQHSKRSTQTGSTKSTRSTSLTSSENNISLPIQSEETYL